MCSLRPCAPALLVVALDRGIREQARTCRRHGLMDEAVHRAITDQTRELGLGVAGARDHDDEIGELVFDLTDEKRACLPKRLHIENEDADAPREQQVADFVR